MQQQQQQQGSSSPSPPHHMTYDEASMQRSRNFIMALQELKSLRPQLYSAAEYCESSYLYSDQKQVVLDNLKDYTVKALVNAVDHLGTVAFKLSELLSQQTTEMATTEIRVNSLAQRLLVCQEYTDNQGLKQQRLIKSNPRFHKHYILPDPVEKQGEGKETESAPGHGIKPQPVLPVSTAGRSLSWHLAAEARSLNGGMPNQPLTIRSSSGTVSDTLSNPGVGASQAGHVAALASVSNTPTVVLNPTSSVEPSKSLSSHLSFDGMRRGNQRSAASRSKSLFSSLLGRRRSVKVRANTGP